MILLNRKLTILIKDNINKNFMFDFADNTELFLKIILLFQNYKAVIFLTIILQHINTSTHKNINTSTHQHFNLIIKKKKILYSPS